MHTKILILGGGLTGLSIAYHLEKFGQTDYLIAEREAVAGGLCRSVQKNGFTFDYGGHLLHLHTPYGKKLVKQLLKNNLTSQKRNAWIYTNKSRVPFPFQANLYTLPSHKKKECVQGLLEALKAPKKEPKNFEEWCLFSFGRGVYEQFMLPYNAKLWGCSLKELTCEWCGPFVPRPSVKEIQKSAIQKPQKSYGYNDYFYYPKSGGCQALVDALSQQVNNLHLNTPVTRVNLKKKTAQFGGKTVSFEHVVSTIPLPEFLRILEDEPTLSSLAKKLTHTSVQVYNLAVKSRKKSFSWVYLPDTEDLPFRIGMQSSFTNQNSPRGTRSFYVELAGNISPTPQIEERIWNGLIQKGIINKSDEKLFSFWQTLPYAYAVYNTSRTPTVHAAEKALLKRGCLLAGRYGKWEYSFMEKSLLQGLEIAKKLV